MVSITIKKVNDRFFGKGFNLSINGKKEIFTEKKSEAEIKKKKILLLIKRLSK